MEQSIRFECSKCGDCCRRIRGILPEKEKRFVEEFAFGKLPVVQLVPVERMSLPLWDFEAKQLKGKSELIKPLNAILDIKSGKAIIVSYYIESDICPFLEKDLCGVYSIRPMACRMFPFNKGPFLAAGSELVSFGECCALGDMPKNIPEDKTAAVEFLKNAFGETFGSAVKNDSFTEFVNRTIVNLIRERKIKPAIGDYGQIINGINAAQKIDLTDFFRELGVMAPDGFGS